MTNLLIPGAGAGVPPNAGSWKAAGRHIRDNPRPCGTGFTEAGLLTLEERCGYRKVEIVEPTHHSKYGTRRFYVLEA